MAAAKRTNLGRGLSALLGDAAPVMTTAGGTAAQPATGSAPAPGRALQTMAIGDLHPGVYQPRHHMDEELIQGLAASIREKGILQPILVRPRAEGGGFEIIAGERRWRAAQRAQIHDVPVIVKDLSDRETLEIALIENLQREDLNPLEEGEAYRRLMEEFAYTQEDLAKSLGKSRSHLANTMRLLGLPDAVKDLIEQGALSAGHGRALLGAEDPVSAARQVLNRGLNVRQTERLVKASTAGAPANKPKPAAKTDPKDPDTLALEKDLTDMLGLRVEISFTGQGGCLKLHYASLEQLDDLLNRLSYGQAGAE